MKKLLVSILCLACFQLTKGQDSITLSDLAVPEAPGLMLLDVSPTSIATPKTTKAFTLSVLNAFAEANGVPQNYAVEFTPYWFIKSENRTALKHIGYDVKNKRLNPFNGIKTSTVSIAFVNSIQDTSGNAVNNVAIGLRGTLFQIFPKGYKDKLYNTYDTIQNFNKGIVQAYKAAGATDRLQLLQPAKYDSIVNQVNLQYAQDKKDSISVLGTLISNTKPILALNVAAAYSIFEDNTDNSGVQFGRAVAWANLSFATKLNDDGSNYLNIHGYARYLRNGNSPIQLEAFQFDEAFDFGGKIEFELKNFTLGYEYIYRQTENTNTHRSAGVLQYKINDQIYLTGSFGKNFGTTDNLISLLGIKWGLHNSDNQMMSLDQLKL
jgi:hypothetical protein